MTLTCKHQIPNTRFLGCYPKWLVYWDGALLNSSDWPQIYSPALASQIPGRIHDTCASWPGARWPLGQLQWLTPRIQNPFIAKIWNCFRSGSSLSCASGLLIHFSVAFPHWVSLLQFTCACCFLLGSRCYRILSYGLLFSYFHPECPSMAPFRFSRLAKLPHHNASS